MPLSDLAPFLSSRVRKGDTQVIATAGREAAITAAVRSTTSTSVLTSAALALGGSQATVGFIGSATYLTKTVQGACERLCRRTSIVKILVCSAIAERVGMLLVALTLLTNFSPWPRLSLVISATIMLLGLALYDMTVTVGYLAADLPASLGRVFGHRQRLASLLGLLAGLASAQAVDIGDHYLSVAYARGALILTGFVFSIISAHWSWDLIKTFRNVSLPPLQGARVSAWNFAAYSTVQRQTLAFFLVWSFAFGAVISHAEASLLTVLHWSLPHLLLLAAIMTGAGALGSVTWGRLIDKMGPYPTAFLCVAVMSVAHLGYILTMITHSASLMVGIQVLWGLSYAGWTIVRPILLTDGFQDDVPSSVSPITFYSHVTMLGYVMSGLAPLLVSLLLACLARYGATAQTGYTVLFVLTTLLRLIALAMLVRIPFKSRVQANTIALTLYGALAHKYGFNRFNPRPPTKGDCQPRG